MLYVNVAQMPLAVDICGELKRGWQNNPSDTWLTIRFRLSYMSAL